MVVRLSLRIVANTAPITISAPTIVVASNVSPSTTAPSTIATSGLTYWCVTTCEIGAFWRSQAYAVNATSEPKRAR